MTDTVRSIAPDPSTWTTRWCRPASPELLERLRSFVQESKNLIEAASKLGLYPSTLSKVLSGRPISAATEKKLSRAIHADFKSPRYVSLTQKLKTVYAFYRELGTLEAVGQRLRLTRERIRQMLTKGESLGLFEYDPRGKSALAYISKEKLIADCQNAPTIRALAKVNNLSATDMKKLLTAHGITKRHLRSYRSRQARLRCIAEYNAAAAELGRPPTTADLQQNPRTRPTETRIRRYWGSIYAFREALKIPHPEPGSRSFRDDTRPWREEQRRLAIIRRMQHLERIRECLSGSGALSGSAIAALCEIHPGRVNVLLKLLIATGEVKRNGSQAQTRYRLVKD